MGVPNVAASASVTTSVPPSAKYVITTTTATTGSLTSTSMATPVSATGSVQMVGGSVTVRAASTHSATITQPLLCNSESGQNVSASASTTSTSCHGSAPALFSIQSFSGDPAGMQELIGNNLAQHNYAAITKAVDAQ